MRLWILFGGGVLILAGAIWPFARRTEKLAPVPVAPAVAARYATPEPPKPEPAKIIEVIDLARAYEPVREPEDPAGAVNPASLIQVPDGPRRIPAAIDVDDPLAMALANPDRIGVLPREVSDAAPVEHLFQMPREVPEKCTGVREDDFVGLVGP